jgi:hypothetical protein
MKKLINISLISAAVIALASCQKTEFDSVVPASAQTEHTYKTHVGSNDDGSGDLFTDKDKCKKCHTTSGRLMGIDWNPPYMSDNRYSSIEELVNNFDFVNNVHKPKTAGKKSPVTIGITEEQKAGLITYLKSLEKVSVK